QHALVQNAVVPQVMRQSERNARACRTEDSSRPRQPNGRVVQNPIDEIVLALSHSRALLFEEQIPGSPSQHQECDDPRKQQWEPAALQKLGGVGSDKYQVNDEKRSVDTRYEERAEAPMQPDESRESRGYRHQQRDGDTVCATERVGGPECDDRSECAGRQEPVDNGYVDLSFRLARGVEYPHAGQKAQLDRLLGQGICTGN